MKRSLADHAARFDEKAPEYDSEKSEEYKAAVSLVVDRATPGPDDVVLDLGTGTGAVALALAADAGRVLGRDISEGMLAEAREKDADRGVEGVSFGVGRFREPRVDATDTAGGVDVVTSNFAMHHLSDEEKRAAVDVIAGLAPRQVVLGDVMFFGAPDPDDPFYGPAVDDPATVGTLADIFTDAGFALTAVERVHDQVGVLVGERPGGDRAGEGASP